MKEVKPIYDEDYDICYGIPDYTNQVILEVGSDYGSTAYYFFTRGAKKVISVEAIPRLYKQALENLNGDTKWIPLCIVILKSQQLEDLITDYNPTLLHMDCEGCEARLLDISNNMFDNIEWIQLEIHTKELHEKFLNKFEKLGYTLIRDYWYVECPCWVTVWRRK